MKDYLQVFDLTLDDLVHLLDLSSAFRAAPHGAPDVLRDEIVFCYFDKPSTRTRVSFHAAIARLGGEAEFVGPAELQLGRGETVEDTAMVISRYARAAVIRTFRHDDVVRFARAATIPVINALTDTHHPCQALADLLTVRDHKSGFAGLRLAYVGAGNNVAHSLVQAAAMTGIHVVVSTPPQLAPDPTVMSEASAIAEAARSVIEWTADPTEAVKAADVIYTDVWLSMGDPPEQAAERRRTLVPYRVDEQLMELAAPDAVFMHCLPAHRGDEVVPAVIDGPRSLVADQAENRMHTEQALLYALVGGELRGRDR